MKDWEGFREGREGKEGKEGVREDWEDWEVTGAVERTIGFNEIDRDMSLGGGDTTWDGTPWDCKITPFERRSA